MHSIDEHASNVHRAAEHCGNHLVANVGPQLADSINGYMYAHPSLEEDLIMFEGVQTTGEGCVSAWLTNTTDFQVYVDAGEAIAFWEADIDGEFELADSLTSEVELMVNALNAKRSLSKRIVEEEHAQRQTDAGAIASSQTRRQPNRVVGSASVTQHHGDADAVAVEVAAEATHTTTNDTYGRESPRVRRHLPKRRLWTLLA